MAKPDYVLLLERNYPNAKFGGSCVDYARIKWKDTVISKPSQTTLDTEWAVLEVILAIEKHIKLMGFYANAEITAGFYSSALGSPFFYDAELTDQLNLIGVVADGNPSYFSVRTLPTDMQKVYKLHSAAQLKVVMDDGKIFKLTILQKFNTLKNQIMGCATITEVQAIQW